MPGSPETLCVARLLDPPGQMKAQTSLVCGVASSLHHKTETLLFTLTSAKDRKPERRAPALPTGQSLSLS